ncbi:hypothetical protein A2382_02895 [Candidatus Woesebacteria bacterium RIFOXYB1_FULL_38_16]|uniref:Resolvase HTH domain-containing protein n=1 Tax=Candidatus Woesebacteria bacterium RIFOXYB1_FULL_38_16 TaxID=1802538 RepID=A0A1F8CUB4_9BACT|nr:MAG: hypothetical protein A2191_04740 [Candidatus Woesebacteria bacterium RIFOXYA1_FULL_38_9]OGM79155.1 MAG: hypothetical protein A2382_02895 [Candidatus Woesebacteria bacterium RIFOXYB1_FULL_38_16]
MIRIRVPLIVKAKIEERNNAIELRKVGHSYNEILKKVNVSKSTLSLWLKNVNLSKQSKIILRSKLDHAQKLGAQIRHRQRIEKVARIELDSISEISDVNANELFLMGVMLYWGEGSKQKSNISQRVEFSNSDPSMCRLFIKWLRESIGVNNKDIVPCVYVHESKKNMAKEMVNYWSKQIDFPAVRFGKTCFTKTVYPRKNQRKLTRVYYGQLRIRVKRSTDLNRKITGWTKGICMKCGVMAYYFV